VIDLVRVLVLVHEFPPVGGGGGRVVEDVCRGLQKRGHESVVVTPHVKGLPRSEVRGGVQIIRIPAGRRFPYKATLFDMAAYIVVGFFHCLRLIRTWKPDVIHVHFAVPAGVIAWALSKVTRVPYVITAHLGDVPGGNPTKTDKWFKWIYPFTPMLWDDASGVTAVSEHTRRLANEHYSPKIRVIPNGVDLDELSPGDIVVRHPPRIVFAGRLVEQKNPIFLVNILDQVRDLPWDCVLFGEGVLRKQVEKTISNMQLQDRVSLRGWVTPEDVIQGFYESDILLMPSLWEGLPVVGVQALAMGLAVVASPVGGFLDLVDSGVNGFLVEGDDVREWGENLRKLLSNPEKLVEFRKHSRYVAEKFSLPQVVNAYEEIIFAAIGSKNM
jgi:glycosyltransferase involved in cell wall biosynthesis